MFFKAWSLGLVVALSGFVSVSQSIAQNQETENGGTVDAASVDDAAPAPATRSFQFTYGAVLQNLKPGQKVNVWLPVATSNHDQDVELLSVDVGVEFQRTKEKKFDNQLIYFEGVANQSGDVPITLTYHVTRRELTKENLETVADVKPLFLLPNRKVPLADQLRDTVLASAGVSAKQLNGSVIEKARTLYDGVDNHMKYNKPADKKGWGQGDALWACNSRFGNCTDFHSVFISSARNLKIPSQFEIGFPIPTDQTAGAVGGYHCWAKFLADGKWWPVDISEADKNQALKEYYFGNLTADRVTFSVGRDLEVVPANAAGPVNFLVYPYAEVDGVQHKDFRKAFRFEDVETKDQE